MQLYKANISVNSSLWMLSAKCCQCIQLLTATCTQTADKVNVDS